MNFSYLCIDDQTDVIRSYASAVEDAVSTLRIETRGTDNFENLVTSVSAQLKNFDGLILDWRLDEAVQDNNVRATFKAGGLAQELRTRANQSLRGGGDGVKAVPIVLWSTQQKLEGSYLGDSSAMDLFDGVYRKEAIEESAMGIGVELLALASGYTVLNEGRSHSPLLALQLDANLVKYLDPRFITQLESVFSSSSVHDIARFILRQMLQRSGVLIDEFVLASRLGIDRGKSPDWPTLRDDLLGSLKYRGPFGDGWARWWAPLLDSWWWPDQCGKSSGPLATLPAQQRVDLIISKTGISKLTAACASKSGGSTLFRTVCQFYLSPLDPVDGIALDDKKLYPWQDVNYLSLTAARERRHQERGWKLDALDATRVKMGRNRR